MSMNDSGWDESYAAIVQELAFDALREAPSAEKVPAPGGAGTDPLRASAAACYYPPRRKAGHVKVRDGNG